MTPREEEALRATRLGTALADPDGQDDEAIVDADAFHAEVDRAWRTVREQRMSTLRDALAREGDNVIPLDRVALRDRLRQVIAQAADLPLTLAARGGVGDLDDEDLDSLLDDLAELERDTDQRRDE